MNYTTGDTIEMVLINITISTVGWEVVEILNCTTGETIEMDGNFPNLVSIRPSSLQPIN